MKETTLRGRMKSVAVGVVVAILAFGGTALAFNFTSPPVSSSVPVNPPSGGLTVTGSWPTSYTINGTVVSSFYVKDSSTTNIQFGVNVTATKSGIGLSDNTILIAGVSPNQGCGVGVCWYTSASTWTLAPGQTMQVDVSVTPHTLGTLNLSFVAYGTGG